MTWLAEAKPKVGPIFVPSLTSTPTPEWQRDFDDSVDLAPLVTPVPHPDDALAGLSDETREILAAGREAIEAWDAAVAAHQAEQHLPDWARPMRGEQR